MKEWMKKYGLPEPELTVMGQTFILTLKRPEEPVTLQVPSKYPASYPYPKIMFEVQVKRYDSKRIGIKRQRTL